MTDDRDFERRLAGWLQSTAPLPAPDLADRLLRTTASTPQRRGWLPRSGLVRVLGVAAVLAVAVVVGLQFGNLSPGPTPSVGGGPSATEVEPSATSSPPASSSPATPSASASVTPSASLDVFPGGNSCQNDADGYAVDYPSDWYANAEVPPSDGLDGIPACRYFAPNEFEVQPNAGLPPTVAISFQRAAEETPVDGTLVSSEQATVGGRLATVRESETGEGGFGVPPGTMIYEYLIALEDGDVLIVSTDSSRDGDYAEHRRAIDLMMQTVEFSS
ncbi:MAG TPA: hypothetical protein VEW95_02230 [Candidatus Limnocylindrales bacterium]|nr:hypothetical protein [Candidatus Limnocylindrales bacterium]